MIDWLKYKIITRGMPKVYYFNLDCDTVRRDFMESQFKKYNIDYERVSQSCYTDENFDDWIERFDDSNFMRSFISLKDGFMYPANLLNHLYFMKEWLCKTDEEHLLIMEDDYDLSLIDYWHFDWDYFIKNLPVDWDSIRLSDDNPKKIRFYLHPIKKDKSYINFGPMLFKRNTVERIVSAYLNNNNKVKSYTKRSFRKYLNNNISTVNVDFVLPAFGSSYSIPLITTEASLCINNGGNASMDVFLPIQKTCHHWWKNERDQFRLCDFFCYGKPIDDLMTLYTNPQQIV